MAKILYCWELGAGAGHLACFRSIAEILLDAGHELTLVVKNTQTTHQVFGDLPCRILPAPTFSPPKTSIKTPAMSFCQVLMECGYSAPTLCSAMLRTWRDLLDTISPDLVIANHSPAALITIQGLPSIKRAIFGTGFSVPPAEFPIPPWTMPFRTHPSEDVLQQLFELEEQMTRCLNQALRDLRMATIPNLGATMGGDCLRVINTYQELDPYTNRNKSDRYLGSWSAPLENAQSLQWDQERVKIFAYLRYSNGLGHLLDEIKRRNCSAILVVPGMNTSELQRIASPTMHFVDRLVFIPELLRECDLAILNGSHGTTCDALLAGKPILQIPRTMEQLLTAANTNKLGASLTADPQQGESVVAAFRTLLSTNVFQQASERFSCRYTSPGSFTTPLKVAEQFEALL